MIDYLFAKLTGFSSQHQIKDYGVGLPTLRLKIMIDENNFGTKIIFTATIEVDLPRLTATYLENTELKEPDTIESMVYHEFNWVVDSGIELLDLTPQVKPTKIMNNVYYLDNPNNWIDSQYIVKITGNYYLKRFVTTKFLREYEKVYLPFQIEGKVIRYLNLFDEENRSVIIMVIKYIQSIRNGI